ncbi:hypothetical protein YC2023_118695 [Brassica napus]
MSSSCLFSGLNWYPCGSVNSLHERCHGQKKTVLVLNRLIPWLVNFRIFTVLFMILLTKLGNCFVSCMLTTDLAVMSHPQSSWIVLWKKARKIFLPSNAVNREDYLTRIECVVHVGCIARIELLEIYHTTSGASD